MLSIVLVLLLTATATGLYNAYAHQGGIVWPNTITDFASCVAAGNPVMESYPRQCNTKDGRHFVEDIQLAPPKGPTQGGAPGPGCAIGGCSSQICGEADDVENLVSTCEYNPQYACYKQAKCERQTTGKCGWTETKELRACILGASESSGQVPTDISVN